MIRNFSESVFENELCQNIQICIIEKTFPDVYLASTIPPPPQPPAPTHMRGEEPHLHFWVVMVLGDVLDVNESSESNLFSFLREKRKQHLSPLCFFSDSTLK